MSLEAFRNAYARDAGTIDFGEQQTNGLSAGSPTQWFQMAPKKAGYPYCLGAIVKCVYVLTASGAATPVAGSDALDPVLNGQDGAEVDVGAAAGVASRSQSLTRKFAEFNYAATANVAFAIAALPTFASAGGATVTVSYFQPVGGPAGVMRIRLPAAITHSYASNVTIVYTSITTQIISTTFAGVCAFRQELSPSLGAGMQSCIGWLPKDVAPDAAFMDAETSATITQVIINYNGGGMLQSTDTDALQLGAAAFAPISGATYTTTAGFVLGLGQNTFQNWQMNFASATTHYIGFLQVSGGADVIPSLAPGPTPATPAVTQTGTVTAAGQVAASAKAGGHPTSGRAGGGRYTYKSR